MNRRAVRGGVAAVAWLPAAWLAAAGQASPEGASVGGIVYLHNAPAEGAVVYLLVDGASPTHSLTPALMDQRRLRFTPSVLPVAPGRPVAFRNSDPLLHNVFSPDNLGDGFDLGTYPEGEARSHTFRRPGAHLILCHVHPEMEGYVVVVPTPYHSVTEADGRFVLEDVPAGTHALHVWERRAEPHQRTITVAPRQLLRLEIHLGRRGKAPRRGERETRSSVASPDREQRG